MGVVHSKIFIRPSTYPKNVEELTSDVDKLKNDMDITITDVETLEVKTTIKIGTTTPSVNADFIGQEFINTSNQRVYKAISKGNGTNDWIQISNQI